MSMALWHMRIWVKLFLLHRNGNPKGIFRPKRRKTQEDCTLYTVQKGIKRSNFLNHRPILWNIWLSGKKGQDGKNLFNSQVFLTDIFCWKCFTVSIEMTYILSSSKLNCNVVGFWIHIYICHIFVCSWILKGVKEWMMVFRIYEIWDWDKNISRNARIFW